MKYLFNKSRCRHEAKDPRLAGFRTEEEADSPVADREKVVPWVARLEVIEPHCPTTRRRERPPMPLATMLWIYFMQHWYALSAPKTEDALYKVESIRHFARLDLSNRAMCDETRIIKFRHLFEKTELPVQMMNATNDTHEQRGLLLNGGTMVHPCPLRRATGRSSATPRCIRPSSATSGTSA